MTKMILLILSGTAECQSFPSSVHRMQAAAILRDPPRFLRHLEDGVPWHDKANVKGIRRASESYVVENTAHSWRHLHPLLRMPSIAGERTSTRRPSPSTSPSTWHIVRWTGRRSDAPYPPLRQRDCSASRRDGPSLPTSLRQTGTRRRFVTNGAMRWGMLSRYQSSGASCCPCASR